MAKKAPSSKKVDHLVWADADWVVKRGHLTRPRGRPGKVEPLFRALGEKLPYAALDDVERDLNKEDISTTGVYIAHDSMGEPRYIGRGDIFGRLRARKKAQRLELLYFSFYVVKAKVHEREIETLLIRGAAHSLEFNNRKKRVGIAPGNILDYEPGATFYERQYKKGRKKGPSSSEAAHKAWRTRRHA